jgi:anthranilate phosphoribosyltransferase
VQLVGVYDRARTEMMAQALATVGAQRALVAAGHDGIDEITTTGPTQVSETDGASVTTRQVAPEDFGLPRAPAEALLGGDPAANAQMLLQILEGEQGPRRDLVLANASAALVVAGKAADFRQGVELAAQAIDSHAALDKLGLWISFTRRFAH